YKVAFLNHLPLPNLTAQRWLDEGLRGGVREFLDQPWDDESWHPPALGDGDGTHDGSDLSLSPSSPAGDYSLEHLKMGPDSYLCLTPAPLDAAPPPPEEDPVDATPAHSWSLLQPLSGTCLYVGIPLFTYSYCHNEEIRQFRELIQARPLPTGAHLPEEDPDASRHPCFVFPPCSHLAGRRSHCRATGRTSSEPGARTERWLSFHCSMATTDTIVFVKEARTCSYVLIIHTPRLCGEPGFMSSKDAREQASISCREIVTTVPSESGAFLPEADYPLKVPRRKVVLPPLIKDNAGSGGAADKGKGKQYNDVLRKAFETIKELHWHAGDVEMTDDDNGNIVIQFLDELPVDGEADQAALDAAAEQGADRIVNVLREAGIDIKMGAMSGKLAKKKKNGDEKQDGDDAAD
ncbi:hypothetical protein B0H10DRAFT_1982444, partial [Mycena sp. CBHHK59/15]